MGFILEEFSLIIRKMNKRNKHIGISIYLECRYYINIERSTYLECHDYIKSMDRYLGRTLGLIIDYIMKKPMMHWLRHC